MKQYVEQDFPVVEKEVCDEMKKFVTVTKNEM